MTSRKRQATDVDLPAARSRSDKVIINVGGTVFTTSVSTLTGSSSYFSTLFGGRWATVGDDEHFVDRDPGTFSLLLSYMRTGCVELPDGNESLARKVLLEAQFLGMDAFIASVKAQAYRNMMPVTWAGDDETAITSFDAKCGGLEAAISDRILPDRFLARCTPPDPPPDPPAPKVIQILPASHSVLIVRENQEKTTLPATALALVENPKQLAAWAGTNADPSPVYDSEDHALYRVKKCTLDAFVVSPQTYGTVLASELFDDVVHIEITPSSNHDLITVPKGVITAEYWKDEADHSKGVSREDVQLIQVKQVDENGEYRVQPLDLARARDDTFFYLKKIDNYDNFKSLSTQAV